MDRKDNMPLWVFLAFSSIESRKGALILFSCSVIFTFYCIPVPLFVGEEHWLAKVFLIDDWSWLAMMIPISLWYLFSIRWIDNNSSWS